MLILVFFINLVQAKYDFSEWIIARKSSQKALGNTLTISPVHPPLYQAGNKAGPHWSCTRQVKADTAGIRRRKSNLRKA